jgi:hypothetical protein
MRRALATLAVGVVAAAPAVGVVAIQASQAAPADRPAPVQPTPADDHGGHGEDEPGDDSGGHGSNSGHG